MILWSMVDFTLTFILQCVSLIYNAHKTKNIWNLRYGQLPGDWMNASFRDNLLRFFLKEFTEGVSCMERQKIDEVVNGWRFANHSLSWFEFYYFVHRVTDVGSEICCSDTVLGRYWRRSCHCSISSADCDGSWCPDGAHLSLFVLCILSSLVGNTQPLSP